MRFRGLRVGRAGKSIGDVLESPELALETARGLRAIAGRLGLPLVFKSSYLKANRTAGDSYVGPGLEALPPERQEKRRAGITLEREAEVLAAWHKEMKGGKGKAAPAKPKKTGARSRRLLLGGRLG